MRYSPTMDEVERLIHAYQAQGSRYSVVSKLDVLMDLERVHDPRALEFMLRVLADPHEAREVRIEVLKRVRDRRLGAGERPRIAAAFLELLHDSSSVDVRLHATLALAGFTEVAGVVAALGALASAPAESIDLRYAAFTALDRAGPTPEYLALLHHLADDETLGDSARSVLRAWAAN
jgi:hypothetical protein